MPSSTLRSSRRGLPPAGCFVCFGSKGRIFSHWASVSKRPYRAIGPPSALLAKVITHFRQPNHHSFSALYSVLKQVLEASVNTMGCRRLRFRPSMTGCIQVGLNRN
jgi:hypothetical protein